MSFRLPFDGIFTTAHFIHPDGTLVEKPVEVRPLVRANDAPWARNDHTGYEVMLGDMATSTPPEDTARAARPFFAE